MNFEPVKYVELHEGFFMCGTNLPTKLPGDRRDLVLEMDDKNKRLRVHFKDEIAEIPETNCKVIIRGQATPKAKQQSSAEIAKAHTAQVSSPQGHVFAGPGGGKSK